MVQRRDEDLTPRLLPLGDSALLVRFSDRIGDSVTSAVVALADAADHARIRGVVEIVPNLVSVLLRYDPQLIRFADLAGELRLLLWQKRLDLGRAVTHTIGVRFGGDDGPDLDAAAGALGMDPANFVARHNEKTLRVLATGFAPGFIYCGLHAADLALPRRSSVRDRVPPGSILFAASQTAITSTTIPTGWHVIGRTDFSNFDATAAPPTQLRAGDRVRFEVLE